MPVIYKVRLCANCPTKSSFGKGASTQPQCLRESGEQFPQGHFSEERLGYPQPSWGPTAEAGGACPTGSPQQPRAPGCGSAPATDSAALRRAGPPRSRARGSPDG